MDGRFDTGIDEHDIEEVTLVARGIATAVAPETGLTAVQAELLEAIAAALTGYRVDYRTLAPLGPSELAEVLAVRDLDYRQRIVHHMVLGELVLRPSFGALVAAEGELGPLFALVERAASGGLALAEVAALFWHCARDRPDGLTRERLGEAVVEAGLAGVSPVLRVLLSQILGGR